MRSSSSGCVPLSFECILLYSPFFFRLQIGRSLCTMHRLLWTNIENASKVLSFLLCGMSRCFFLISLDFPFHSLFHSYRQIGVLQYEVLRISVILFRIKLLVGVGVCIVLVHNLFAFPPWIWCGNSKCRNRIVSLWILGVLTVEVLSIPTWRMKCTTTYQNQPS
jgi:hypothetical protein